MDIIELSTKKRAEKGKNEARKLRKAGFIPAIMYSRGKDTILLSVDYRQFKNLYSKGLRKNSILLLSIDGTSKSKNILLKEIQKNPVTDEILHLDFYEIDIKQALDIEVKIRFVNEDNCIGVKEEDGIVWHHLSLINPKKRLGWEIS